MNKTKFLGIVAALLLLSNLLLLGFFFFRKPPIPEGPKKIIIERLRFDQKQIDSYSKLVDEHRKNIKQTEDSIMVLKNQLYATLKTGADTTAKKNLIQAIGALQIMIENTHYRHFEDIRSLCNSSQYADFDKLCSDITNLFPQRGKKPLK